MLERGLSWQEQKLLFQRTWVQFPAWMSEGIQLPATPAPEDPTCPYGLHKHPHTYDINTHTHTHSCVSAHTNTTKIISLTTINKIVLFILFLNLSINPQNENYDWGGMWVLYRRLGKLMTNILTKGVNGELGIFFKLLNGLILHIFVVRYFFILFYFLIIMKNVKNSILNMIFAFVFIH